MVRVVIWPQALSMTWKDNLFAKIASEHYQTAALRVHKHIFTRLQQAAFLTELVLIQMSERLEKEDLLQKTANLQMPLI